MKQLITFATIILISALVTSQLHAHHSSAATFDPEKSVTVDGVVTEFKFRNPHILIYLDVKQDGGSIKKWVVESAAATGWRRAGWHKNSLKPGERLRVTGDATFDGSPMVWLNKMELLDKTSGELIAELSGGKNPEESRAGIQKQTASAPAVAVTNIALKLPSGEPNFMGTTRQEPKLRNWTGGPDKMDDPMPYNEKGKIAVAAWDLKNDPQVFCDPPGLVRQAGYTPYGQVIRQYPDHVTIEYEEYGGKRAVFFSDKLPRSGVPSHLGDSVAHYEGDTLVIDTVNLLPNASGHRGKPLSANTHVREVYSRSENPEYGTVLTTVTTVTDSEYLTQPWTITRSTVYDENYQFIENECVPPLRPRPPNVWQDYEQ